MDSIYKPAEDSFLLQRYVREYAFGRVLDMGTGSGIQALAAMEKPSVREVVAVDINPVAVSSLQQEIQRRGLRKITVLESDLYAKVTGKFNLIIFNPPYLPQDKGVSDVALYGGKKGWEISERFFQEVSPFLFPDGKILFLFSSLTNKEKIDTILEHHLFDFKLLDSLKLPLFEELYIYEIWKSPLLRKLEQKNIEHVEYYTQGKRGLIFKGILDRSKLVKTHFPSAKDAVNVAIKINRADSEAIERIRNEAKWLEVVNKYGIGPRYLFHDEDYVAYEFVKGVNFLDWVEGKSAAEIISILEKVLKQCYQLDLLRVNKEEMHHPFKHIIITSLQEAVLLDFERCAQTLHPKNVTQFVEFICKLEQRVLALNNKVPVDLLRNAAREYKQNPTEDIFKSVLGIILGVMTKKRREL